MKSFLVNLNDTRVGQLYETPEGAVILRLSDEYIAAPDRPILSQFFEDDLGRAYKGNRGRLPAFFANIVPEGNALRSLIEKSLGVEPGNDLELLVAVGEDLPGAVRLHTAEEAEYDGEDAVEDDVHTSPEGKNPLRFSLAGVQLKFSVLQSADRIVLPARGSKGEWIVKLPSLQFPLLTRNEYATLKWASNTGLEVPDCMLLPLDALPESLRKHAPTTEDILVIKRFDRANGHRIHQEDFAQVVGFMPERKYSFTYEKCARLVRAISGEEQYFEFVRRLAFMIVSGNMDAHLKNWSLVYPDGIDARLSPLYDQVFTCAWPNVSSELALRFSSKRRVTDVSGDSFAHLAKRAGADPAATVRTASELIARAVDAWRNTDVAELMPPAHRQALSLYWQQVPLLRNQ